MRVSCHCERPRRSWPTCRTMPLIFHILLIMKCDILLFIQFWSSAWLRNICKYWLIEANIIDNFWFYISISYKLARFSPKKKNFLLCLHWQTVKSQTISCNRNTILCLITLSHALDKAVILHQQSEFTHQFMPCLGGSMSRPHDGWTVAINWFVRPPSLIDFYRYWYFRVDFITLPQSY